MKKAVTEGRLLGEGTAEYLDKFHESTVLILMIESPAGLSNLPDILTVPRIKEKIIGPHDFSVSSCVPEVYESAVFLEVVSRNIETCVLYQISVGIQMATGNKTQELIWIEKACNLIIHSSDTLSIALKLSVRLVLLKGQMGLNQAKQPDIDGGKGHAA